MPAHPSVFRQAVERQVGGGLSGKGAGAVERIPVGEVLPLLCAHITAGVACLIGAVATG